MKPCLRTFVLFLMTSFVSLQGVSSKALAAAPEVRKGVIIEAPAPGPEQQAGQSPKVIMIGDTTLPVEVLEKLTAKQLADILRRQTSAPKSVAEVIFNEAIMIPGVVFGSLAIVSFFIIYFSFRKRREMLETVRIAIQSGQTLPASFLEALESKSKPTPDSDLRKAVLLIALGLSGMGVLATLADQETSRAWSIGLVPTLLGVGYLFLWMQAQKRRKAGSNDDPR